MLFQFTPLTIYESAGIFKPFRIVYLSTINDDIQSVHCELQCVCMYEIISTPIEDKINAELYNFFSS